MIHEVLHIRLVRAVHLPQHLPEVHLYSLEWSVMKNGQRQGQEMCRKRSLDGSVVPGFWKSCFRGHQMSGLGGSVVALF